MARDPTRRSNGPNDPGSGPIRTCVGCRSRVAARDLIRLVELDGGLVVSAHAPGRGAWICRKKTCIERAGRTKAFSRAFRSKLADAILADTLLDWLGITAH